MNEKKWKCALLEVQNYLRENNITIEDLERAAESVRDEVFEEMYGDKTMNEERRSLYVIYNKLATDIAEVELKSKETTDTYECGMLLGMLFAFTQAQKMVMKAIKEGRENDDTC